nr:hypothetical protein Iba_chr01bCG8140 [Ipomoea batatas]
MRVADLFLLPFLAASDDGGGSVSPSVLGSHICSTAECVAAGASSSEGGMRSCVVAGALSRRKIWGRVKGSNLVTFANAVAVSFKPPSVCRRQRLLESQPLSPSPPSLLCSLSSSSQPPRLAVAVDVASQPYRRHVHSPRTQAARRHSILILVVFPKKEPLRSKVGMGDGIAMAHQAQAIVSNIEFLIWSE